MIVEIVSTNWEDDYVDKVDKFEEYQCLGVPEYWIVDYWAIASRSYLGNPKVPTLFIFTLNANKQAFQFNDPLVSVSFPELKITTEQIWSA